nr:MAG TPA: hypothetical protein [Caudoviricetes sp.]
MAKISVFSLVVRKKNAILPMPNTSLSVNVAERG